MRSVSANSFTLYSVSPLRSEHKSPTLSLTPCYLQHIRSAASRAFRDRARGLTFNWLGHRYAVSDHREMHGSPTEK
jgi:hypothetical protein